MSMDRKQLERMSRGELEQMAREVGVSDPEDLEDWDLVEEILTRIPMTAGTMARSLFSKARGFVEQAVVVAKSLYDEAKAAQGLEPEEAGGTASAESEIEDARKPEPTPEAEIEDARKPEPTPEAEIATATLAQLYESQAHPEKALQVYEDVLARDPSDEAARAGVERLGRTPAAPEAPDGTEPGSLDLVAVDPSTLHASWEVTEPGIARATALLGSPARQVLRVFGAHVSAGGVETVSRDEEIDVVRGESFVRDVHPSGLFHAAVGLLAEERFVPIVKAGPVRTPAEASARDGEGTAPAAGIPHAPSSRVR